MTEIVEYKLKDGTSVYAEVNIPESETGVTRAARGRGNTIQKASEDLEAAVAAARPAAEAVVRDLRRMELAPDEITVELGLKLSIKFGAVIAETTAEGNFRVAMKWSRGDHS